MVKRILNFIHQESSDLHQAAYFLGIFALLSQILGLFRDRLLAHHFGASLTLDLYYAAFRLPDFLFVSVASLVSISVLIPLLVSRLENKERCQRFLNSIFSFFFILIIFSSIIVFILAPHILKFIFPGFPLQNYGELVLLTRILLLSPILLGFSNLIGSIVQANRRFILYALSPIIYNFIIILSLVFLAPKWGIRGVVFGVIIGALFHLLIQLPYVFKINLVPRLTFKWFWEDVKTIIHLSVPRTLALSSSHLSLLFLFSFASTLETGSITIFNLSFNLQSVPLSIVGVSYSLAAFPMLAQFFANKEHLKFVEQITVAAKHIIFWSVPVTVLFIVLRAQIVRVILGSGQFNWEHTRLTAAALAIFSISILCQSLNLLFTRGYYAAQKTAKPLIINLISSIAIIFFSFFLIDLFKQNEVFRFFIESLFRVQDISGTIVLMLPLGYSLGMILNTIMLLSLFRRDFKGNHRSVFDTFFQSLGAGVIMGFAAYLTLNIIAPWFNLETLIGLFFQGFISGIFSILIGVTILWLLGSLELQEIWKTLHKKFWKTKVIGSEAEIV